MDSSSNTQAIALEKPKDNLRELPDLSSSGNNETQTSSNEGSTRPFVSERKHITDMGNGIGRDIRNELVEINITGLEFDSFVKSNSVPLFIVPQVCLLLFQNFGLFKFVKSLKGIFFTR